MSDLDRIQAGGTTEFNSNLQIIERLHYLTVQANHASMGRTMQDLKVWYNLLTCMDREIDPLLNENQRKELAMLRKKAKVPENVLRPTSRFVELEKEELDNYERKIRYFMHKKGLGVRAKEDAGAAIMR